MFKRTNPPKLAENEVKALDLLTEAERLECNGNDTLPIWNLIEVGENQAAVACYARAYKLWPELELR
jgi:hypothetical protein